MDRIALALAACEGISDEELAKRGPGSLKYNIERKYVYMAQRDLLAMALLAGAKPAPADPVDPLVSAEMADDLLAKVMGKPAAGGAA